MSAYQDFNVDETWTDVFSEMGLSVGEESIILQNKGGSGLLISITETKPTDSDNDGVFIMPHQRVIIPLSAVGCWIRSSDDKRSVKVAVDLESNIQDSSAIPSYLITSAISGIGRLAVDSQQTSFEANQQFGYSSRIKDIAYGSDIVYKFITTVPINVFSRTFEVSAGGRWYQVYKGTDFTVEPTGTFATAGRIEPMNAVLRDGVSSQTTNVTITRAIAPTYTLAPTAYPITQQERFVGSQGSQSDTPSSYSPDGIRRGLTAGTYYILMTDYGDTTTNTNAVLELVWEERTTLS